MEKLKQKLKTLCCSIGVEYKVELKNTPFDSLLDLQKFMLARSVKATEKLESQ